MVGEGGPAQRVAWQHTCAVGRAGRRGSWLSVGHKQERVGRYRGWAGQGGHTRGQRQTLPACPCPLLTRTAILPTGSPCCPVFPRRKMPSSGYLSADMAEGATGAALAAAGMQVHAPGGAKGAEEGRRGGGGAERGWAQGRRRGCRCTRQVGTGAQGGPLGVGVVGPRARGSGSGGVPAVGMRAGGRA